MKAQELIKLNNEKREKLNDENLKYYEGMLLYIRTSWGKKEFETEEILSELLDHLLDAQENGKTAKEVFGQEPREYAKQITNELPKMNIKERILFFTPATLFLIAGVLLVNGIFNPLLYYSLNIGTLNKTIHLGSLLLESILVLIIFAIFIYIIMRATRMLIFKNINKKIEFLIYWILSTLYLGIFILIFLFVPDLGYVIAVPFYIQILLGAILAISGYIIYKVNN
ncbi:DUF1129 family protein [Senegalia massiliensis]|uniref:DUF1129 family protein n=1 Tax=Senegalia massiliensis TaxID=1720316 RepID=A0A845QYK6_9CLOT|nr:DUF1129 family protein [Senegalia massiliensis]NBI06222.1 DUF1129 family protein [Senegalia massiliensis]